MTYDAFIDLLQQRRSIRYFSDRAIDRALIEKVLAAGRLAPSVENSQPWHFHVVLDAGLKTKLMETSCYGNFVAGAGAFIVVTCDRAAKVQSHQLIWNPRELEYSCGMASYSMMLAATSVGLGSCWVSMHHGPAHDFLKLQDHHVVVGGLMLGWIKPGEEKPSREHDRGPLQAMATFYE